MSEREKLENEIKNKNVTTQDILNENEKNNSSSEKQKDTRGIGYVILGGGDDSIEKRVGAVADEIRKNPSNKVIVTGYKEEIEKILKKFNEYKEPIKNSVLKVLSYDTVTNITNSAKYTNNFEGFSKLVIPTSQSHADRVKMIFEKKLPKVKADLEFRDSKEAETGYANIAQTIYRVFNPSLLQYASIALRPINFIKGYLIPLIKQKTKTKKELYDILSQTP